MSDWISSAIDHWGYFGIAMAMLLENVFPPIPSEVVMPASGFEARQGTLSFVGVVLAGTTGSLLGALGWYWVAIWVGQDRLLGWLSRHGAWIGITRKDAEKALKWFDQHGSMAVFIGRLVPGIRTLISVPAGFARMPMTPFLLWTSIGTLGWTTLLAAIGWWLRDQFRSVGPYISGVGTVVIVALVAWWLIRIAKHHGWFGKSEKSTES